MEILRKLVEAPSISGSEENVRDAIAKEIKPFVDGMKVDKIGNLIAHKGKGKPVVMLVAHMDEIGLMVKYVDEKGFIKFEPIGGWDERILPAKKVKIYGSKGPVVGVIGSKPIHIMRDKEEQKHPVKINDLYIDVGADKKEQVEQLGIEIGDFIQMYGSFDKLANQKVTGYGFDNRIGCSVLVETVKRLKNFKGTFYAAGVVQEELGLIGARGSIFGVNPDVVIGTDTTIAGDTPDIKPGDVPISIGKGPVVLIKDAIGVMNPGVKKWILETAKANKINVQLEVTKDGATDASIAPLIREGIPSGSIMVPTRYVHTPIEVADTRDIENAIKLIVAAVQSAGKYF